MEAHVLGWNVSVRRLVDEASARESFAAAGEHPERRALFHEAAVGTRVAVWQAGLGGLTWIEEAARRVGGVALARNGYPNWYLVLAKDVQQTLRDRVPYKPPMHEFPRWISGEGDIILPGWAGKTTINVEQLDACSPDEWLLVEAWDES